METIYLSLVAEGTIFMKSPVFKDGKVERKGERKWQNGLEP